jgi:Putative metallopeptidase
MRWGFIPVLLPMLLHSLPALAQGYAGPYNQQIEFTYTEPRDPAFRDMYERLKRREVLHELAQFLAPLRLPRKLVVTLDQCGAKRVAYKRDGPVTVCYELIAEIERVAGSVAADQRGTLVAGASSRWCCMRLLSACSTACACRCGAAPTMPPTASPPS